MKKLILKSAWGIFLLVIALWPVTKAEAFLSPFPIHTFEKGQSILQAYRGHPQDLRDAAFYFNSITQKHPDSPLGYLGMSQVKLIEAYRSENHYNMRLIQEEALPLALSAMRAGPTLLLVQNNYDRFEDIITQSEKMQENIRRQLVAAPEKSQTYFELAEYLLDQGDYPKAVEFFLLTYNSSVDSDLKLKSAKRIGWLNLTYLNDPKEAVKYLKMALEIKPNLVDVQLNLGQAYLELNQFELSQDYLQQAQGILSTPEIESKLYQVQAMRDAENGRIQEAILKLQKGIALRYEDTLIHYRLGNLYFKNNDFALAYEEYLKVIKYGSRNPQAFYFAGRAAYSLGRSEDAREFCSQYLQYKTEGQEADWIREKFPELSHR